MNLFAYGTLMWPDVLETLLGRRLKGNPAAIEGFVRLRVKGEHYPAIVPSPTGEVEGVLYGGLSQVEFDRLDRFEGEEYERTEVFVGASTAMVYVLTDEWKHIAEPGPWFPEHVEPKNLAALCSEYNGWTEP